MDTTQENPLEREHSLCVLLPGGVERNVTVHGSKPVMDLLVSLCASQRLNPSDYTVEVRSPNKSPINCKANCPVGLLDAERIALRPKGLEEKTTNPPYMPEVTVRLLINYNVAHKTVVRVNPDLPLGALLPKVCDKCEFNSETTVLLRDSGSEELLDLSRTLNDYGLREVFAKDTEQQVKRAETPSEKSSTPPPPQELPRKQKKLKENSGFLSLFRRKKEQETLGSSGGASSAPTSPSLSRGGGGGLIVNGVSLPLDMPKKRRAPAPPIAASHSFPNSLGGRHVEDAQVEDAQRPGESTLRSTKRRAPPPPSANALTQELQADGDVTESLEDSSESGSQSTSFHPPQTYSSSFCCSTPNYLQQATETHRPRGRDLSDARAALAKVLMSSVSKSSLVKRLSHSSTFAKLHNGSSSPRRSDDRDFCSELESVLESNLPTESEWEDPAERKGITTFKVVPPKKDSPPASEVAPTSPELSPSLEEEDSTTEVQISQVESKDDSRSETPPTSSPTFQGSPPVPQGSDSPRVSPSSEVDETSDDQEPEGPTEESITELAQSIERVSTAEQDVDASLKHQQRFCLNEEVMQEKKEEEEEEANFPPPPPPVFFNEHADVTIEASPPPSPASSKRSEPPEGKSTSPPLTKRSTSLSRFAQAVTMAVQKSRRQNFCNKGSATPASSNPCAEEDMSLTRL